MMDADLLCDQVAFIANGNIKAIDSPKKLKEKNSNHQVIIEYMYQGKRSASVIEMPEQNSGIPFLHDEFLSIHSKEPTLEDILQEYHDVMYNQKTGLEQRIPLCGIHRLWRVA